MLESCGTVSRAGSEDLDGAMRRTLHPSKSALISSPSPTYSIEDKANDDGHEMSPKSVFSYLTRLMYYQRSRLEPYWNTWVVGGFKDGES